MARGRALNKPSDVPARILIPDLTGMILSAALRRATEVGFTLATIADPELPWTDLLSSARWVVAEQDPATGAGRYAGDTVVVILRHDDGGDWAGDREPRTPLPRRRTARAPFADDLIESGDDERALGSVHRLEVGDGGDRR